MRKKRRTEVFGAILNLRNTRGMNRTESSCLWLFLTGFSVVGSYRPRVNGRRYLSRYGGNLNSNRQEHFPLRLCIITLAPYCLCLGACVAFHHLLNNFFAQDDEEEELEEVEEAGALRFLVSYGSRV